MKDFLRKIWNAIVSLIYKVPYDKLLHFIMGLLFTAIFAVLFPKAAKWCILVAIVIGVLKELFDFWTTKQWDWKDFLATVIGGLTIWIFTFL